MGYAWALEKQSLLPGPSGIPVLGTLGCWEKRGEENIKKRDQRCPPMTYGKDLTQANPTSQDSPSPRAEQAVVWISVAQAIHSCEH